MIDIDRYRRIDEIFQAALELEPHQRAQYVSEACTGDAALLKEVEDLLASDGQHWELIGSPAFEMVAPLLAKDELELEAGDSIGHYQVVSLLGVGGMGQVYLAQDTKLGRKVALKLLPTSYTRDESRLRRFQQEARAASALNHPNILTIHELGEVNGEQFIATEFVEGETLRERLNHAPLNSAETLDVAVQIAGALAAAHKAGIVHRDVKPENIMLRHDGYVKVLDFGLAKLTEQQEPGVQTRVPENVDISSGLVMGTVKYMSPEQARGQQVDPRSDIFSFGVVLYEMIAGHPPFEGKNSNELISAILTQEPSPLTDVPDQIQGVISRALRKKKEDRYQMIEDVLEDLKNLKEDKTFTNVRLQDPSDRRTGSGFSTREVSAVSTETSVEYVIRKMRRHKTATVVVFVTLVFLLAGISYRYFFTRSSVNSIAVMRFANESGDPTLDYLSESMPHDVIEGLSKVPRLEVKDISTVSNDKAATSDVRRIGQELNVNAVLSGRLMRTGDDLALSVQLLDPRNGNVLWQREYRGALIGLAVWRDKLRQDLATHLSVPITDKIREKLARLGTENSDAERLYRRGVIQARKLTAQDINQAIDLFWQAIQIDPKYARAYAAMASAHRSLTMCCDGHPSELVKAKDAALKAVELDPELAEGHSALASVIFAYDWNWAEAEKEYKRALELDPNSPMSHLLYAEFLGRMGRREENNVEGERARELEPLSPFFNAFGASKDSEKAVERIRFAIDLDPNFYFSHSIAADIYSRPERKMYDEAIAEAQKSKALSDQTWSDVILSNIYKRAGRPAEASRPILEQMLVRSKSHFVPPYHIAMVCNNVGDKEQALVWLEKAYEIHDPKMTFLNTMNWKNVENDPRFKDILHRMNFPAVSDEVAFTPKFWSAQYIATGIRSHKIPAALIAGVIIVGILATFFYLKKGRSFKLGSK